MNLILFLIKNRFVFTYGNGPKKDQLVTDEKDLENIANCFTQLQFLFDYYERQKKACN